MCSQIGLRYWPEVPTKEENESKDGAFGSGGHDQATAVSSCDVKNMWRQKIVGARPTIKLKANYSDDQVELLLRLALVVFVSDCVWLWFRLDLPKNGNRSENGKWAESKKRRSKKLNEICSEWKRIDEQVEMSRNQKKARQI